ncbi:MAG: type II toxin-antitoxin system RelE/ParE family toxin [Acidobacteria bacterium]|nr:type II toxin-antitoxin system RelE/ParE family toxin [Acidobacteriota bacterium]
MAISDLDDIVSYIAAQGGPEAAERIYTRIMERIGTLSVHPARCRLVPELKDIGVDAYRELIVAPHRVFFRISGNVVGIVGVLDGRRDLAELLIRRTLFP